MPPKYLGNARSGITTCLNKLLLKYHESIRGVLLAFSDVKLARAHGCLLEEDATINFPVTLKVVEVLGAMAWVRVVAKCSLRSGAHNEMYCER